MTLKQWAGKSKEEAQKEIQRLEEEFFHLRLKKATGQLDKIHKLGETRRDISRGLTYLKQQENNKLR